MSLSVAAIQPPSAIYHEEQRFSWWVYGLLALVFSLGWSLSQARSPASVPLLGWHIPQTLVRMVSGLCFALPLLLAVGVLRMGTVVTPAEVRVWFGWVPTFRKSLAVGTISRVEVIQHRAAAESVGWLLRQGRNPERALVARGDRGVRLYFVDGSTLVIGSQRPEELGRAIEGASRSGI